MTALELPPAIAAARPNLGAIVAGVEKHAAYGAVLLSAAQGLRIIVDDREERVTETPPAAGTVISAFDGTTLHEAALGGFDPGMINRHARELAQGLWATGEHGIDPGPERRADFVTSMAIPPESLSIEEKIERCRKLHRRVRGLDQRIVNIRVGYTERGEISVFRNRANDLAQRVQRVSLGINVAVAGPNGVQEAKE